MASGSMAVWCEHRVGAIGASAEVHFNYWRIAGDRSFVRRAWWYGTRARDFIESGILISDPRSVERVSIYLPGQNWEIADCGSLLGLPDLAEGIFNKDLTCNVAAHPASVELLYAGQQHSFCRVHIFSVDEAAGTLHPNQLTVENLDGGTLIVITRAAIDAVCDGLGPDVPAYFRLRAYATAPDRTNAFIRTIKPKDRAFQTGYSVVEYVDFRLNEARVSPIISSNSCGSR